jgi:predicted MFS family arabinose efflux permease
VRARGLALTVAGTALIACTYGLARFGFGLFVPQFRTALGLSAAAAGLIATGGFASYCGAALLAQRLVGAGRLRLAVLLAGGTATAGCAAVAVSPDAVLLGLAVLVAGSGAGIASPVLVALVAETVPSEQEPRAQTVVNSGTGFGVALAGPVALALADQWRAAWAGFAVLAGLATLAVLMSSSPGIAPVRRPASALRLPDLLPPISAAVLFGAGSAAVWTFGRDLVVTAGHLGPLASAGFWTLLGVAGISGALVGDAVRRFAVPATWTFLALLVATATAGLALAPGNPVLATTFGALFGGSYVAASGVLIAWGSQLAPAAPGSANAVVFLALSAGQAAGALLLGTLLDRGGSVATFAVAAGLAAVSCVLPWRGSRSPCGALVPVGQ